MQTVATCMEVDQAQLLRIKLENHGIPAVVSDDLMGTVAPLFVQAIGGIRVQVPDEQVELAREILAAEPDAPVDLRDDLACPKCGSGDIDPNLFQKSFWLPSILVLLLCRLPLPLIKRRYRCRACGHLWK